MKKLRTILILLIITLPTYYRLFLPGYFSMHDDLQVMRIYQMEKCFNDGQIPCRWSPDMAFGYGQAMFNFYSAFPYYLGMFFRIIFMTSIIDSVKLLFMLSQIASIVGMYYLGREVFGKKAGILSAVLYAYAPYHALDIYVRGALAESFALAIYPFIWLFIYRVIKKCNLANYLGLTISLFILFTTHNISIMIFAPVTAVWMLYLVITEKKYKTLSSLFSSLLLAIGLASFFLIPNLLEQGLIQKEFFTIDYLSYVAHFASIKQLLLARSWGYGPSIFGPEDTMSFQVGWPHWWIGISAFLTAIYWFFQPKKRKVSFLVMFILFMALAALFLTHSKSTPIWNSLPILAFVQFPWRFLGIVIFLLSFIGGVVSQGKGLAKNVLLVVLVVFTVLLNFSYFRPEHHFKQDTDQSKLSGESLIIQQKAAILDYLPRTSPIAPKELAPEKPVIVEGEGYIDNYSKTSNSFFFDAELFGDAVVSIPVIYFPGWTVVSGNEVISSEPQGNYGTITVNLPQGKHIVQGRFENTPVRNVANALTVVSAGFLVSLLAANSPRLFTCLKRK